MLPVSADDEDDGGDRRIDQPRPMHDEAAFRPHPVLMQVEPALAGQQVADLDQPQQTVIVAAGIGQFAKAGAGIDGQRHQHGKQRQRQIGLPGGSAGLA